MTRAVQSETYLAKLRGTAAATKPLPVEVVRPNSGGWASWVGNFVGRCLGYLLTAYVAMLLLPEAINWHPGYGQTLALVVILRIVQPGDEFYMWTRPAKKSERSK